ncbi:MAG TPA: ABC transporter permease [Nitrospirae bacterium]|nr:cell division protein FtsX [bacterium BMS3Abin09]GBE41852.1 cell division protein FtsX [bacterium BMS3Bbin09]HDO25739.1 ABC transporter permease [Nitrospirota bacterium]
MRTFIYSVQTAYKSILRDKWINLLTILSISICLLIISAFVTITMNMDSLLNRWSKSFGLVVYLDDSLNSEAENTLKEFFQKDPDIIGVKYISKEDALEELRLVLGSNAEIIEGLKENPLPSSFELKLKSELLDSEFVKQKAAEITNMTGVEEVQYGEKWLSSLNTISRIMKLSATFLGTAIFIAIIFITYNTIKIFFYRRNDEIETLKLLGATRGFIRLPFLIEGLFIGIISGIIGSLALYGIQSFILIKGTEVLPAIRAMIITFPLEVYLSVPIAGAIMSFTGSLIAVGKIKY